jgi:hypothetical protein
MHQQLWGYKVEDKLYLGVREQKRLNTTDVYDKESRVLFCIRVSQLSCTSSLHLPRIIDNTK